MKKIAIVVALIGMMTASTITAQQNSDRQTNDLNIGRNNGPNYPMPMQYGYPQQPVVNNYMPAPKVMIPNVNTPVTINYPPVVDQIKSDQEFTGMQYIIMFLIAGVIGIICWLWGFFTGRRNATLGGNNQPTIIHVHGSRAYAESFADASKRGI